MKHLIKVLTIFTIFFFFGLQNVFSDDHNIIENDNRKSNSKDFFVRNFSSFKKGVYQLSLQFNEGVKNHKILIQ